MDAVRLASEQAAAEFGGDTEGVFAGSGFAQALRRIGNVEQTLDGRMVYIILYGRDDIRPLPGGSHYQIVRDVKAVPK